MAPAKKPAKKSAKKSSQSWLQRHALGFTIAVIAVGVTLLTTAIFCLSSHDGDSAWFYLPATPTNAAVRDSLRSSLGNAEGTRVYYLWRLQGGRADKAHGAYRVEPGQSVIRTARRMVQGAQTPVRLTFNNVRTLDELAQRVATRMECTPDSFTAACRALLPRAGFDTAQFTAAFIPDTYELYWTAGGAEIVRRLLDYRNRFWNDERRQKAAALGLTPAEVAALASIVQSESNIADEHPLIARLYLNRLNRGMKLQADPTVKFAVGDFSLRRITGAHLATDSPYNTYRVAGLPPGPICVAEGRTIDAVLDAPDHDYLYMCAKDDFSGRHAFATDYATHMANARRYQAALNARNIH